VDEGTPVRIVGKLLQHVGLEDLRALVDLREPESRTLEYKEALPNRSDRDRKEFLADVSALANSSGGVIIYGIREKREDKKKTGIPEAIVGLTGTTADEAAQRVEQMIRSGLDPALGGFLVRTFNLDEKGDQFLLAVGVPASLLAPHAVSFGTTLPIWHRVGTTKGSLTTAELRQMFLEHDTWEQEAEAFRKQRILLHTTVEPLRIPSNLSHEPALYLQVVPLGRMRRWVDLRPHRETLAGLFNFGQRTFNERYTFDGILRTGQMENPLNRYVQWFRFGGVELFSANFGMVSRVRNAPALAIASFTLYAVEYTHRALAALDDVLGIPPPYAVFVNALHVQGRVLELTSELRPKFPTELLLAPISEIHLLPPPILFDERPADIDGTLALMRMVLDALWQAGGLAHCWMITPEGAWKGRTLQGWQQAL
jgi:schlafen family protein